MKIRWLLLFITTTIVIAVGGRVLVGQRHADPIAANSMNAQKLNELRRRAADGDPAAQYAMTLFLDDAVERESMLKKAGEAGYPPAAVTLASELIRRGGQSAVEARAVLERPARRGYYPAIPDLAECIEQGRCGPGSKLDAATWALVSRKLADRKLIRTNELEALEVRVLPLLSRQDLERAGVVAEEVIARMDHVDPGILVK